MILRAFLLVVLAAATAFSGLAQAQQYRWVDKNGKTQFTDTPPPPGARDVRKSDITATKAAPAQQPFEVLRLQKDFPVTLYTSPPCKEGCELARGALNKRGVPFKEVQVFDPDTNDELKKVSGGLDVPTLVVGRSVQRGYEQGAFDALLDSAGYPKTGILPALTQKTPETPEGYVTPADKTAKPVAKAAAQPKPGPYDSSGLTGPAPKPGQYDPSGLTGPAPKPGQYGIPGEGK
jgi:Domain of unknown function (DUF4124)/Glutaredoxin